MCDSNSIISGGWKLVDEPHYSTNDVKNAEGIRIDKNQNRRISMTIRNISSKVAASVKKRGVKGIIFHAFGWDRRQEEIDTLYFLLNQATDITKIEPAKDESLRIMQLCNAELLHIFDKLCAKHNLRYWLDGGTLLGARRHKGFIPWDDDIDVMMPREDYDKVIPLMKDEMEKYGIVVRWGGYFDNMGYMQRLAFAYRTIETGIWMDIFPADFCDSELPAAEMEYAIKKNISLYQKYYSSYEKKCSVQQLAEKKKQIFENIPKGKYRIWYGFPEIELWNNLVIDDNILFPLKTANFEGYRLNVPANVDRYLSKTYGNDYMDYPRSGLLHHTDPDGGLAQNRAKKHDVDMNEVLEYLASVFSAI